jgi:aminoglycoside phosphotransferase (APT) family kinase protein
MLEPFLNEPDILTAEQDKLKLKIQELLGKKIVQFDLKGKGAVNIAYYVETIDRAKYVVKQERTDKEFQPQNDLVIEAKVAQQLHGLDLSVPIPDVAFVSANPKMYGYEYVEGDTMLEVWEDLSESERIDICRNLGHFHAEIGKKFTKEMAEKIGTKIDMSAELHPEVSEEYNRLILDVDVPENFKTLAKEARSIFDMTRDALIFQFLHNDSHHENIIIKDRKISGIIDFGNAEHGEIAKEFSRYIRDYPDYFGYIVSAYEEESGNNLSQGRLVSNALLSGFIDIVDNYRKGGDNRIKAEKAITTYGRLMKGVE